MVADTVYRRELRERIVRVAMEEFKREGVRRVKMDDIARRLGISKRTLYEIYGDKESLLFEGVRLGEEAADRRMGAFSSAAGRSAMDVVMEFYHMQMDDFTRINPLFLVELRKYPRIMAYLEGRKREREEASQRFFARGVEEGFFRPDVDYDIVSAAGSGALRHIMESQMYKRYPIELIFRNVFFLFIRGFCTERGLAAIDGLLRV